MCEKSKKEGIVHEMTSNAHRVDTRRHAMDETLSWLLWYKQSRLHSTLNYLSPMQFEKRCQEQLTVQPGT